MTKIILSIKMESAGKVMAIDVLMGYNHGKDQSRSQAKQGVLIFYLTEVMALI